jgi:hypothetical protein
MPEGGFHKLTPELRQKYINNPFLPKGTALQNIIESLLSLGEKKEMISKFKDYFENSFQGDFMLASEMVALTPNGTKGGIIEDLSGLILGADDKATELIKENELKEETKEEWKQGRLEAIGTIVETIVPSMTPSEQAELLQHLLTDKQYAVKDETEGKTADQKINGKDRREAYDFLIKNVLQSMDPKNKEEVSQILSNKNITLPDQLTHQPKGKEN